MSNVSVLDGCDFSFDIYDVVVVGVWVHVKCIASRYVKCIRSAEAGET